MELNLAVSQRIQELLVQNDMTRYRLAVLSGLPRSTVSNIVNCTYPSVKLSIIHDLCQGFGIDIQEFFSSPLFNEENLDP